MGFFEHPKINCSVRNMQKVESKTSQNLRVSSNFEEDMEDITRILNGMNSTLSFKSTSGDLRNEQNFSEDIHNFYRSVPNYLPPIHSFKDQGMEKCSNIPYYSFLERRKNPLNYGTLPGKKKKEIFTVHLYIAAMLV
ncbi:hypothetical protein TNIN_249091 [Trichonephila inaurata madagascariensis]|uniref:Uncharacterized protein n=1 Tax=Trichonephila inaurata madagascariensis TaxID=2747483 RepID=A0A8X7CR14_9ARAC|nr:hypothetical protein TNIN_249091 [Trichonephila inaurata madagascariensis]